MKPRVAVLFEFPSLNGGERSMLQTIELVGGEAFELVAVAPGTGRLAETLAQQGIRHVDFECRDANNVRFERDRLFAQLARTIQRIDPQIVHANSLSLGRLSGAISQRLRCPCIAHLRDIIRLSGAAIRDLNRNHALIAVSEAARAFHVAQGIDSSRTSVIYNGVDPVRFSPRPKTGLFQDELGIPLDSFVVLTVGQIGLRKGHDVLADAAPSIVDNVKHAQFVIVGQRDSSKAESIEFERNLAATFARNGLEHRLHGVGYRDDVERWMNEADLLVHPAKQEPLGRVLLESAASGLAIVATNVGGTKEILRDGESAWLIEPGNARELAEAVVELAADPDARRRLAAEARHRVVQDFSPAATAEKLTATWYRVLQDETATG